METITLDLRRLRAFQLVAKKGSLRSAASQLLLSIPAVSLQIHQLEHTLGVELFEIVGRRLVITPMGQTFLRKVNTIFDAVDDAVTVVSEESPSRKQVTIAIGNDLLRYFSSAITKYIKQHPEIDVSLRLQYSRETITQILEGSVDVGIGYFSILPKEITKRSLLKSGFSLSFTTKHPLAKCATPTLKDIAASRLILLRQDTDLGRRVRQALLSAELHLSSIIETAHCQASYDLMMENVGAAITHNICLYGHHAARVRTVDLGRLFGEVDVAMIYRKRKLSPVALELIELITSTAKEQPLGMAPF